jgi:hypothetical protein
VLGAEVFTGSASAWAVGCFGGSPSLLVSANAGQGSVNVCGWVVVSWTRPLAAWDEPLTG